MWHEARKQEKKIRGIMVDYKRRAERRREYYERIKQDPAQFLQVHGRPCRIHLDPAIALAADSPATMMPWQGHLDNMIDRFDVRAHLDAIPDVVKPAEPPKQTAEEIHEDRQTNYERYRTLVQNDYLGVTEDKFLHQIFIEERFGPIMKPGAEDEKKKLADKKAAIAYVYEDSTPTQGDKYYNDNEEEEEEEDEEDKEDLSDIDLDVTVDVGQLSTEQCSEMNVQATIYGMIGTDFISYLHKDKDEADELKLAKELEEEKAMYSGRKSRRERRALREKKLQGRRITSPPSYAAKESPVNKPFQRAHSSSRSRSPSPVNAGQITFITSFGGEGSEEDTTKTDKAPKTGNNSQKINREKVPEVGPHLPDHHSSPSASTASSSTTSKSRTSSESRSSRSSGKRRRSSRNRRNRRSSSSRSSSSSSSRSRRRYSRNRWRRHGRRRHSHSRSRGRSRSSSSSRSRSKSRSRSRSSKSSSRSCSRGRSLPAPPVRSYYRHSLSHSSSNVSDSSDDARSGSQHSQRLNQPRKPLPVLGKTSQATKSKLTPQEKLKRKMQAALNRQYKADKRAEMEKIEKQEQERHDRAEELREMAIKLRQRERERRHRLREIEGDEEAEEENDDHSEPSRSSSRSRGHSPHSHTRSSRNSPEPRRRRDRDRVYVRRSRSRSRSRGRSRSPRRSDHRESSNSGRRRSRSRTRSRSRSRRRSALVDY